MAVDTTRLRFGDLIAGGSAVLLFFFTFLQWFKVTGPGSDRVPDSFKDAISFNAWEAMPFFSFLLLLCIAAVIAVVVIRLTGAQINLPVPLGTIILGAGALAVLIILFRLLLTPDPGISILGQDFNVKDNNGDIGRSYGAFLGLLAAIGILAGGFLSARERGEAIPGVDGPIGAGFGGGGGGGGGPLGAGQPAGGQPAAGGYAGQPAGGQPATAAQPVAAQPAAAQPAAAAQPSPANPPADWYDDPRGEARLRYWDGTQWTDQTAP